MHYRIESTHRATHYVSRESRLSEGKHLELDQRSGEDSWLRTDVRMFFLLHCTIDFAIVCSVSSTSSSLVDSTRTSSPGFFWPLHRLLPDDPARKALQRLVVGQERDREQFALCGEHSVERIPVRRRVRACPQRLALVDR